MVCTQLQYFITDVLLVFNMMLADLMYRFIFSSNWYIGKVSYLGVALDQRWCLCVAFSITDVDLSLETFCKGCFGVILFIMVFEHKVRYEVGG